MHGALRAPVAVSAAVGGGAVSRGDGSMLPGERRAEFHAPAWGFFGRPFH